MVLFIGVSYLREINSIYIKILYLAILIKIQSYYRGKVAMTLSQKEEFIDVLDHFDKISDELDRLHCD